MYFHTHKAKKTKETEQPCSPKNLNGENWLEFAGEQRQKITWSEEYRFTLFQDEERKMMLCFNFAVPSRPVEVCYTVEKNESGGSFLLRLRWQVRNRLCKEHTVVEGKHFQKIVQPIFHRTVTPVALEVVSLHIR